MLFFVFIFNCFPMLIFLHVIFIQAILLFVFFISGKLILNCILQNKPIIIQETFTSILIGFVSFLLVYSILHSHFKSIHLLFLPILFYAFYTYKFKFRFRWTGIEWKDGILPFLSIVIVLSLIQFFNYYDFVHHGFRRLFLDNYTYSSIASNLYTFGTENSDFVLNDYLPAFRKELMPYRYSDLWLASFVMLLFKQSDVFSFYLIATPFLLTMVVYFIFLLIYRSTNNLWTSIFIAFILSFSSLLFIPVLNPGSKLYFLSETSFLGTFKQKTALSALFFLLGLHYFKRDFNKSFLFLLVIPILYVSYLPAIWGALFILLTRRIFILYINKLTFKKDLIRLLFLLLLMSFFFLFYQLHGQSFNGFLKSSKHDIPLFKRLPKELYAMHTFNDIKAIIVGFFTNSIPSIFFYLQGMLKNVLIGILFFIPFLIFHWKQLVSFKAEFKFIGVVLSLGLFLLIMRDGVIDNFQFFTNTLVFLSLFFSYLFAINYNKMHTIGKRLYILVLAVCCVFPILSFQYNASFYIKEEHAFVQKTSKICHKHKVKTIFIYASPADFDFNYYGAIGRNILFPLKQTENIVNFSIANPEVYKNLRGWKQEYHYHFNLVSTIQKMHPHLSKQQIFKKYKINSFLFYPGVCFPSFIKNKPKIVVKNNDGYRFVYLK